MSKEFNKDISKLTAELAAGFLEDDGNEISSPFLPSRNVIIEILGEIRRLFFPRHFCDRDIFNCTIDYFFGDMLLCIEEKLSKQIGKALMRKQNFAGSFSVSQEVADYAAQLSCDFMERLPYIRHMLSLDVQAFFDGDPAAKNKDEIILSYPGMFAIMVYRIAHELYVKDIPIIPRMMTEYAHSRTGVDINPGAEIGEYFFIDHATGVVIGETCTIHDHVKLYQGVTLGALSTRGGQSLQGVKRHPTIERNVTIYANATILGGDTVIGEGSVIGGSCFITSSVPANARVQTISEIEVK